MLIQRKTIAFLFMVTVKLPLRLQISIHVPRVGNDLMAEMLYELTILFQSTFPAWGTTQKIMQIFYKSIFETNTFVNFCASSEKTTPYRIMKAPCRSEFEVRTCKGAFVCFHSAQVL